MRLRTVSWIRSASRARVACQWKAKPRMSTTKPVVADSVTVSAVVERQSASASVRRLQHGERAERIFQRAHRGEGGFAVGQRDLHGARGGAEGGQRLRGSEHVEDVPSERRQSSGVLRDDRAVAVGDKDAAARAGRPGRQRARERRRRCGRCRLAVTRGAIELGGEMIGERLDHPHLVDDGLPALFEHLHGGADADRQHEGDDENRNGAAQQRLGAQQAAIGGVGNRLCQPLDGIGT